jgi:hypothetical protein
MELREIRELLKSGRPIQVRVQDEFQNWVTLLEDYHTNFYLNADMYRVEPETKTIPFDQGSWKELGPVVWIRSRRGSELKPVFQVGIIYEDSIYTDNGNRTWIQLQEEFEYSTDLKTWHPCHRTIES